MQRFNPHPTWLLMCIAILTLSCLSATTSQEQAEITTPAASENPKTGDDESIMEEDTSSTDKKVTSAQHPLASNKIALIIAISQYDPATGWGNLGSEHDVHLIKAALAAQGFDTVNNVAVLRDQQATRVGIANAIQKQLVDKAQAGSIVVFHYSGHGQQVADNNNEELDGYDEALVPYDAPNQFIKGKYEGENHMRDDELGALLNQVRQKIGPGGDLTVVLDACHSGTATRGIGHARGTMIKIAPEGYQPSLSRGGPNEEWTEAGTGTQLAPMVVISGASADQLNYEAKDENGNWVGSLSYAFSRTLTSADADATYRGLFDKIRVDMSSLAPRQTPQLEGEADRQILGGQAVPRQTYFKVKKWFDKENVSLHAGQLFGLFEQTQLAFYPIDTRDTTGVAPKATGIITSSHFLECGVQLNQPLTQQEAMNSWVFVKSKNFGNMSVKVKLDIRGNDAFETALREEFAKVPLIQYEDTNPELVIEMNNEFTKNRGSNALQIVTANDYVYFESVISGNSFAEAEEVTQQTISFAQTKFLRDLTMEDPDIKVTFEIIPIQGRRNGAYVEEVGRIPLEEKTDASGTIILREKDFFRLRLINHGSKKAYYCMLDIQPDNVINSMIPNNGNVPSDYLINPKDTIETEIFEIFKPYGNENFKLIATRTPIDLSPIVTSRGTPPPSKGEKNPLEQLVMNTYKTERTKDRGPKTANVPPASGNIETLVFRIEKAQ